MLRLLIHCAFALLLAVLMVVAGYGLLAAARQPVPFAPAGPEPQPPPPLEVSVATAPPLPEARAEPASLVEPVAWPRPSGPVTVQVRGGDGASAEGLGVGVVDGTSGALLAWKPLEGTLPTAVELPEIPVGRQWAVLAAARSVARSGYVSRRPVEVAVREGRVRGTADLDARRYDVAVSLTWAGGEGTDAPLLVPILRRTDDPDWIPIAHREPVEGSTFTLSGLGAGSYVLQLDGADVGAAPTFVVPGTDRITIPCRQP